MKSANISAGAALVNIFFEKNAPPREKRLASRGFDARG